MIFGKVDRGNILKTIFSQKRGMPAAADPVIQERGNVI